MAEHRHFPRRLLLLLPFLSYQPLPVQAQSSKPYPGILVNFRSTSKPGENEEVQLFYMFVKSQRNPVLDPLVMWLTGGPGCSTFSAFFYGNGNGIGTFLQMNLQGYILGNPVTDSYIDGNAQIKIAHRLTLIPDNLYETLFAFHLLSPNTNLEKMAMKGSVWVLVQVVCQSELQWRFVTVNASNEECVADMEAISELISPIYTMQVLEPNCGISSQKPNKWKSQQRSLIENSKHFPSGLGKKAAYHCHEYMYVFSEIWSNDESVREALHVREGTKRALGEVQCFRPSLHKGCKEQHSLSTESHSDRPQSSNIQDECCLKMGVDSSQEECCLEWVLYYFFCTGYSGDHDMSIPHVGTQEWINLLNLTLADTWRAWYTDAQVSGYTQRFTNDDFSLTFATVKGAGHVAIEYKAKECYAMIKRWFGYYPL
ncbi:Serine carboxypeptidase-like 17 [Vitis vinifera]|uniref:Serine carboxypeptidase-like 17 n=1 Tax=Vitis vinifera TaxID=29760 RepID=A0A438H7Y3_VITVI|nr:Serine carboxypeptidase-like 17 [Vitis vinifera]